MVVKFSKDKVRKLINQYYREVLDIEGKTIIRVYKDYVGYGMGEHTESYPYFRGVDVYLNENVKKIGVKNNEKC